MIKKLLLTIAVLTTINGFAQISFDTDSAYVMLRPGYTEKCIVTLTNSGTHDVNLTWRMISSTIKDFGAAGGQWNVGYCDCKECTNNEFTELRKLDTCPDPMIPGQVVEWYITVDPQSVAMADAEWVVEVSNNTDSILDTISYFLQAPNSVNEVSYNANVTSYPNPASAELMINYELTNVQAPILNVYSLVGVRIGTYAINGSNGLMKINTSELENGMYFYSIEEKGQRVFTQRFNVVH
tara:strand:+ start:15710 stop:16426 length:717 start_codon:yes stop_codon:yes gene_type:complete